MPRAQLTNNASTTLATGISNAATSLTVATGAGALFPAPGANYFYATLKEGALVEIVKVTARTGDVFTVTRAQDNTTAQTFTTAATVKLSLTAAVLAELQETSAKDASAGYAGLTLFKLNLKNAAGTITSWFTTAATAARTWTLPDKDGTVAMTSDFAAPGPIGGTTPSSVAATALSASGKLTVGAKAVLEAPAWDTGYMALRHAALAETAATSALFQSAGGSTFVNSVAGQSLYLGINGAVVGAVTSTGLAVTGALSATGAIGSAGTNPYLSVIGQGGAFQAANKFGVDHYGGNARIYSSGPNTGTRGGYEFHATASDGGFDEAIVRFAENGSLLVPGVYSNTTASAANTFVDTDGTFKRSTSTAALKTDVEDMDPAIALQLVELFRAVWYRSLCPGDNAGWSWFGGIAEEVALIDPRFVHYGYLDSDYDQVEVDGGEAQEQATDEVLVDQTTIELIDGVPMQVTKPVRTQVPRFTMTQVVDAAGNPVMTTQTTKDADGDDVTVQTALLHPVPVMLTVRKTHQERQLKAGAAMVPVGLQYERFTVPLMLVARLQGEKITALSTRLDALEAA